MVTERLAPLQALQIEVTDDSAAHAGHQGNAGGGHLTLRLVSSQFAGKSMIMRHRAIYDLLHDLIPSKIHALSIQALSPDEI